MAGKFGRVVSFWVPSRMYRAPVHSHFSGPPGPLSLSPVYPADAVRAGSLLGGGESGHADRLPHRLHHHQPLPARPVPGVQGRQHTNAIPRPGSVLHDVSIYTV